MSSRGDIPVMPTVNVQALADRCLAVLQQKTGEQNASPNGHNQVFIAVAGTPGSGKSFIAKQVRDEIHVRYGDDCCCVVIGMDGYHLTRQQLKEKAERGDKFKTDENGNVEYKQMTYKQLMARRGAGFTYCPEQFIHDLRRVKQQGQGSFPVYDRDQHDPVPDGVHVRPHHKIVLVEGLYLLCLHDPDWAPLGDLWDDAWYIDVSMEETKRRLIERHLKYWNDEKTKQWGGNDKAAAARKAKSNDMLNAACIRTMSRDQACLIVQNEHIPEKDDDNADVEAAG